MAGEVERRAVLQGGLLVGAGAALSALGDGVGRPAEAGVGLVRGARPVITHGVQSGDVTASGGVLWARADRPARMLVELSGTESFRRSRVVRGPLVTPRTDLTGKVQLHGLPAGEQLFYRVRFADPDDSTLVGPALSGRFHTAPTRRRDLRFVWSGDLAGQGWGINPDFGGFRIFDAMLARDPDFYLCSGDTVYADGPLAATVPLPGGDSWRNLVTEEKSKVAETLAEFRGQYKYNLIDEPLRRFAAAVPQINQWDDHETRNNWYPGQIIDDPRYTETRIDVLAARARQAFIEYLPMDLVRPDGAGRIYRTLSYGPLLGVFVVDMRTYKDPEHPGPGDRAGRRHPRLAAAGLAEAGAPGVPGDLEGDRGRPAARPDRPGRREHRGDRPGRPGRTQGPRTGDCRPAVLAAPASGPQHGVADRRRALRRRALLRPEQGGVQRVRPVLGVRLRPVERRRVRPERAGADVRAAAGVRQGTAYSRRRPHRRLSVSSARSRSTRTPRR